MQDKRSRPRLKVSMPVQVVGRTVDGEKFREVCQTQDASAFGLCLVLESIVQRGTTVFLSMQMPSRLRLFDLAHPTYQIYAQVRRVQILAEGGCEVGLSFIGKNPPPGTESFQTTEFSNTDIKSTTSSLAKTKFSTGAYQPSSQNQNKITQSNPIQTSSQNQNRTTQSNPTQTFAQSQNRTTQSNPVTNKPIDPKPTTAPSSNTSKPMDNPMVWQRASRRDVRHNIPIDVMIEFLDASGKTITKEPGLVINISRSGACVMTTKEAQLGSKIKVFMTREDFTAISSIKAVTTGQGGVWNLHLEFIDKCWIGGD